MAEVLTELDLSATWHGGAPQPVLFAGEHRLRVIFSAETESGQRVIAILRVNGQVALNFGLPHENCSSGHRLAHLGFEMESAFEVVNSSWIDDLRRMTGQGWQPNIAWLADQRHFIFSFRDRVLEFVAPSFQFELTEQPCALVCPEHGWCVVGGEGIVVFDFGGSFSLNDPPSLEKCTPASLWRRAKPPSANTAYWYVSELTAVDADYVRAVVDQHGSFEVNLRTLSWRAL